MGLGFPVGSSRSSCVKSDCWYLNLSSFAYGCVVVVVDLVEDVSCPDAFPVSPAPTPEVQGVFVRKFFPYHLQFPAPL